MRKKKMRAGRIISMLLAVTMVLTSLPQSMMSVSAAEIVSEDTVSSDAENEGAGAVTSQDGEMSETEKPESEVPGDNAPDDSDQGEGVSDDTGLDAGTPEGDKPDGSAADDDKSSEGTSQDGESGEDNSEENKEQESEDGVADDEEGAAEVSEDTETYEEAEPDMLEQGETVYIQFYSEDGYGNFDISDSDGGDIGTEIAIENPEEASFKVMPHEGYVITGVTVDKASKARISRKEEGAGYECRIFPGKDGYSNNFVRVTITVKAKSDYNLTFKYADEDVEALVATNGESEYQPENNVAIQTTNESSTSFRLKMKGNKVPVVIQEPVGNTDPEERINLTPDVDDEGGYGIDGEGYYCYSLGKVLENTVITIEEGCRVSFEYDKAEISDLFRAILEGGDEDDIGLEGSDVWIDRDASFVGEIFVAKGEPFYFGFERDYEKLGIVSVIDGDGKPCKEIFDPNSCETVYKVVPQGNTKVIIEVKPYEIPVKYVDSTVKNISVSSTEDEQITFNAVDKKITNVYKAVEACNISFELEEGKPLDRVEAVYHYDYGEGEEWFEYKEIKVAPNDEGVYSGSFSIEGGLSEIRIVAGESYTLNFELTDGFYLQDRGYNEIEIGPDKLYTVKVTDGDDYIIRMLMKDEYYLATPSAVATIGEETRKLEVIKEDYVDSNSYHLEITPTTDMDIKISLVPESIPFNYAEGAITDIAVNKGKAALSEDKKSINIYSYDDLEGCEITFTLGDGKTVTRAYCEWMVSVYDDEWMEVIGSKTYTDNIPIVPNGDTNSYKLDQSKVVSKIWNSVGWVDSIYIAAGDTSAITFDVPEGKASVCSFNNYKYDYVNEAITSPVEAAQNEEYLFGVELSSEYNASSVTVTAGTNQEELKVKSYVKYDWDYDEEETIAYYSYTPTKASETIKVNITPQSIPVKYEAGAVKNLSLTGYEEGMAGKPELDGNKVLLWNYNMPLKFELELESGKKLSGIFGHYAGENADSSVEKEILYTQNDVNGLYEFDINNNSGDLGDLLEIEIVTDKVNLSDCKMTLSLGNAELSKDDDDVYYTSYKAQAIEPEVTLTYDDGGTEKTLDKDKYVVSYEDNRKVGIAAVTVKPKEGSGCVGSKAIKFRIDKAAAPTVAKYSIYTEAGDADDENKNKNRRTLNLSKRFNFNTALNEEGLEPVEYTYVNYTPGGVLDSDSVPAVSPVYGEIKDKWDNVTQEFLYYQLTYSVADNAAEDSPAGTIVINAKFDNYLDAQITIEVSVKEKTTLKLGAERPSDKKYDATAYSYGVENVYVAGDDGKKLDDSDTTYMPEIRDSIRFHYTGEVGLGRVTVPYDSYEAPVKPGHYYLGIEISETNDKYKAEPYSAGDFRITLRNITIKAEHVELNVGDEIPEEYPYTIDDTELLPGDTIVSKPVLRCSVRNTETEGRYEIKVNVDEVEDFDIINSDGDSVYRYYYIETRNAWLTVSKVEVVKKQIMLIAETNKELLAKTYDGEAFDAASLIEAKDGAAVVTDAVIDIKYSGDEGTNYALSSRAPVNAGTYTVKAKVAASDNQYKSDEISFKIVINKAAAPTLQEQAVNAQAVTADTTETLDIAQYIPTGYEVTGYGTVGKTDPNNVLTGNEQVSAQGILSYTLKADAAAGTAVLTIPVEFKNHIGAELTVKINLTSKILLILTQAAGVAVDSEYNGNAYVLPEGAVTVSGTEPGKDPKLVYVYTLRGSVDPATALHAGQYTVKVTVAEEDENYVAKAPLSIDFEITKKTVNVKAKSGEWNKAFDERPTAAKYPLGYDAEGLIGSDNLVNGPASYAYTYIVGGKETALPDTDDAWKALEAGTEITVIPAGAKATDDYNVAYTAGKLTVTGLPEGDQMYVPDIAPMTYTGSQLKPQVKVYVIKNGEAIGLTTKDYKVTYGTNKDAGKGTVTITGKGNYTNVITKEFTIEKASIGNGSENKELGITLKYTDQSLNTKATKLVTSLKYKKVLKEGTDFTVTLTKEGAATPVSKTEGNTAAKTPTGDENVAGAYTLHIEAKADSNYSGYIEKTVYIAEKNNLIKNAKITLKKKSFNWGDKNSVTFGNYSKENWGGFYLNPGSSKTEPKDFTVSIGTTYLTNSQTSVNNKTDDNQYFISYTNNDQAGTATITITGDGKTYFGTKSATFKINGTQFKAGTKTGNIILPESFNAPESYTGKAITKDLSTLGIVGKTERLTEGTDYSVTFSNNVKKGNATVIITADPKSGYTGIIRKNFKIATADLKKAINNGRDEIGSQNVDISFGSGEAVNEITGVVYKGAVPYSKSGAVISGLVFINREGQALKAGTDYTVKYSYADKKDKKVGSSATMTLKGKGNYSGTLDVTFTIGKAAYSDLDVSVASVKLGRNAAKPKVTVKDGKKALTVSENDGKEVKVTYTNNEPEKVQAWLAAGAPEGSETTSAPTVTITMNNANYEQTSPETRTLNIYSDKLVKTKLTINWRDTQKTTDFTYDNGEQVKPGIESITYDSKDYTVKTVGKDCCAYDSNNVAIFRITYGANNKSGKNAGSVTIEGLRLYGGKLTEKFEIKPRDISVK